MQPSAGASTQPAPAPPPATAAAPAAAAGPSSKKVLKDPEPPPTPAAAPAAAPPPAPPPPAPAAPPDPVVGTPVIGSSNAPVINTATPAEGTVVPSYFSGNSAPELVSDYREDGHNWRQAKAMLSESVFGVCKRGGGCCEIVKSKMKDILENCPNFDGQGRRIEEIVEALTAYPSFNMLSMRRLENVELFERFSHRERQVERALLADPPPGTAGSDLYIPDTPEWLKKLGERNGLSKLANTHYMLHGTTLTKLQSIVKHGLRTKFGKKDHNLYGSGLYFADAACKAAQYCAPAHGENVILVCRVIIGRSHLLRKPSDDAFAPEGFHSMRVEAGVTCKQNCAPGCTNKMCRQLHNEVIVYNDCDVYPEFVLGHSSPMARHLNEYGVTLRAA